VHREILRALLAGGDRRSIAGVTAALAHVRKKPADVAKVVALASDDDWLVSMRALDLLEKLAADLETISWVEPHRAIFLGPLAGAEQWERRLQIVRAIPHFAWSKREIARAAAVLERNIDEPQLFVRAWAVDGLARLAERDRQLVRAAKKGLRALEASGKKSLLVRARHIRSRLADLDSE
jgi:hypothetical protein